MTTQKTNNLPTEHEEQSDVIAWFDIEYREYKALLFAIPNGTHLAGGPRQRGIQASKLKREGQRNGVPDLMLPVPASGYHGLFIEMKRLKGGKVSPQQQKWIKYLNGAGYKAVVCAGAQQAKESIKCYLGTTSRTMKNG